MPEENKAQEPSDSTASELTRLLECPKCGCPHWNQYGSCTADNHTAWKDTDGTWYNGPARQSITKSCAHCGWTQQIEKRRGKIESIKRDAI